MKWLVRQPLLIRVLGVQVAINATQNIVIAVAVLYATRLLAMSKAAYGLLLSVGAIGGLVAGACAPWLQLRMRPKRLVWLGLLALSASLTVLTMTRDLLVATGAVAVNSACFVVIGVLTDSTRQASVPDAMLGPVSGVFRMATWGIGPVAAVAGGVIAELGGLAAPFAVTSGIVLAVAVLVAVDRTWTRADDLLTVS